MGVIIHAQGSPKRLLKFYLKKKWRYKVGLVHATSYLLKLQIDHVILDGNSQVYMKLTYRHIWNLHTMYIHTERYCKYRKKIQRQKSIYFNFRSQTLYAYIAGSIQLRFTFLRRDIH